MTTEQRILLVQWWLWTSTTRTSTTCTWERNISWATNPSNMIDNCFWLLLVFAFDCFDQHQNNFVVTTITSFSSYSFSSFGWNQGVNSSLLPSTKADDWPIPSFPAKSISLPMILESFQFICWGRSNPILSLQLFIHFDEIRLQI